MQADNGSFGAIFPIISAVTAMVSFNYGSNIIKRAVVTARSFIEQQNITIYGIIHMIQIEVVGAINKRIVLPNCIRRINHATGVVSDITAERKRKIEIVNGIATARETTI